MSTLILSLLLLILVGFGVVMNVREQFHNPPKPEVVAASPALANMLADDRHKNEKNHNVDTLAREQEVKCPACPVCPNMANYVRMDQIPCWNCTMP
jgi:hypothetical protein